MTSPFCGIYSILQTPFSATGDLLWSDFERDRAASAWRAWRAP